MKKCRPKIIYLFKPLLLVLFTLVSSNIYSQSIIKGKVVSLDKKESLPGVSILLKGTTTGAITDVDGNYTLSVPNTNGTLVFSFIGYTTEEVPINGRTEINIELVEDLKSLTEVVVVGYGTVKKSDLTGAVSSVDPKKITQVATVDVNQALQGKVAGVQVTPNSGEPGASAKVRIRGVGTINNSNPLYVVDGFPIDNIDYIAPTDIESTEVLKDASATAIYGNRGANGVILITTKRGKSGNAVFNFNAYTGVQNPWKQLELTNATEYATLFLEAAKNDGIDVTGPNYSAADYASLQYVIDHQYKGTDWQKEVIHKNAVLQNYNLSVNGGTDKFKYNLSGTYFDQDGTVKNTNMRKLFLRWNNDLAITKFLKSGLSIAYINVDLHKYNNDQYSGILPTAISASPVTPAWDVNTGRFGATQQFSQNNNPARLVNELKTRTWKQNKFVVNVFGEATLLKGLTFRSNFGAEYYVDKTLNYYPQFFISPSEQRTISQLFDERNQGFQWTWSNFFNFNRSFGDHSINAMIGQESQLSSWSKLNVTGQNVLNLPSQYYVSAIKNPGALPGSDQDHSSLMSYFGRLNYSFKNKYLLTATVRRDASSRFIKKHRVGIFPSFSLGWNIHEESFLKNVEWLSALKLRGGYGLVGNQNSVDQRATFYVVDPDQRYVFGTAQTPVQGRANTRLKNSELIWETTSMSNFGVDAGFFNRKLNITVDYFIKKTYDMIVDPPMPKYVGANAPKVNAGDMLNKGLEVTLNYNKKEGDFHYDLGANVSFIKNKLVSLGGGESFNGGDVNKLGSTTRMEEGQVFAYFYGRKTDGIFNSQEEVDAYVHTNAETGAQSLIQPNAKPGDVKFVDLNNDGVINEDDRTKLGSAMPDFTYGFNAFLEYKNFDLKLFFQGTYGNQTVNSLLVWNESVVGATNSLKSRMNRWTPENPDSNEPRMTLNNQNNNNAFSDRYVEDGSYLRLKNIQLGYRLPQSILSKVGVQSLRIYISSDNLLTFTKYRGYEPEVGDLYNSPYYWGVDLATYPQSRTVVGGLNVTF